MQESRKFSSLELRRNTEELTESAILGTNRRPANKLTLSEANLLSRTLQDIDKQAKSPEATLLDKLTALSMTRKSGQLPRRFVGVELSKCPAETKACVGEKSLALLKQILEPESKGGEPRRLKLISDWLRACNQRELRVPSEFVPRLLEACGALTDLHPLVACACGEHYQWLLSQNSLWQKTFNNLESQDAGELARLFDTAEAQERARALSLWRKIDSTAAAAALQATWLQETPESRAALVKSLSTNLSGNDETFLEEVVLKDRRKEVRTQAAQLLAQIPQSRFILRMKKRAEACFSLRNKTLTVTLPEALDDDAPKDGIDDLQTNSKLGQKAGWMMQFIAYTDPSHWLELFQVSAEELLAAVLNDKEWRTVFELGLLEATGRYQNKAMMEAILANGSIHLTESQAGLTLLKLLPRDLIEQRIISRLPDWSKEKRTAAPRLDIWYYLEVTNFDWSEAFTASILNFIIKECKQPVPVFGPTFTSNAGNYALRMHVGAGELIEQVELNLERTDVFLPNAMERMTETYKLRLEIARSFA
jgi:hypothetical protein